MVAEALRRLFLRPGRDRYRGFVEELTKGGKLALELEKTEKTEKGTETYLFRLLKPKEGGGLEELGIKLKIEKVGEGVSIVYALMLDAERRGLFERELKAAEEAAEELRGRLPVEDPFAYMAGWPASDVAISRKGNERVLEMSTSHLWQLAETHALFGWSGVAVSGVNLTLEGPKPQFHARTSLEKLDEAIRESAEGGWLKMLGVKAGSWDDLKRQVAERWDGVVEAAVRRLGKEKLTKKELEELEALKGKLNDDKVAREAVAPALLLIQAEKLGVNEESLRYFAAVISGAVGGDGHVSAALERVELASGSRAIALLWGAAFRAHGIEAEVRGAGRGFNAVASGDDAVRLARLYFLFGPPLLEGGDERVINHKLAGAVELGAKGALNIRWEGPRLTQSGIVAADLVISEGGVEVKYDVYLREKIALEFESSDRSRVELAARLLKLAGVSAEVKSKGGEGKWRVRAYTDMLAAGRKELRDAIADIVREALAKGWVDAGKAERWLDKLEGGLTLKEGWPKYHVGLTGSGALAIRYQSTNPGNIEREAKRLEAMGLEEGVHFAVKMPEGGMGYVSILREGLARAAWLSVHGSGDVAKFVEYILQRAEEEGEKVHEKALEVVEEGRARGSLRLAGFEREVDGRLVRVIGGGAEFDKGRSGKTLLRIKITAEVDGVRHDYTITFGRYGKKNMAVGYAYIREEADAERFSALVEALTGKRPKVRRTKNGEIVIECYEGHLGGLARYVELAEAIARWLAETGLPRRP
jgi:hypothetical protein